MSVLIIDDDASFRDALESDLRGMGYTVYIAAGFDSMVDVVLKATPGLAIVDAHLPHGESRQVITVLKRCGIPVVLLCERDVPKDRWEDTELAGDVTLTKPIGLVELDRHLQQLRPPAL